MTKRNQDDGVDRFRTQWAQELPDLDTTPMALLGRINRIATLVDRPISDLFARFGLDRGAFDVIGTLRRAGSPYELTPTALYTSLMLSSGGLTDRLARLEKAGLITRTQAQHDKRSFSARLTARGRQLAEAAFRADMMNEKDLLQVLTPAECKELAGLLKKLLLDLELRRDQSAAKSGKERT